VHEQSEGRRAVNLYISISFDNCNALQPLGYVLFLLFGIRVSIGMVGRWHWLNEWRLNLEKQKFAKLNWEYN
jgi:hypothetical protein